MHHGARLRTLAERRRASAREGEGMKGAVRAPLPPRFTETDVIRWDTEPPRLFSGPKAFPWIADRLPMLKDGEYMCSDLVRLRFSTGEEVIGHLETISEAGCTVTLDCGVRPEAIVGLECVDCPRGAPACFECKMTGSVSSQNDDPPIGLSTAIEFIDQKWCPGRWKPRHLFCARGSRSCVEAAAGTT